MKNFLRFILTALLIAAVSVNANAKSFEDNTVLTAKETNTNPEISYEHVKNQVLVKVSHLKREDVVAVLWNGSDMSNYFQKLDTKGLFTVTDDTNGFTIEFDDELNLFSNGTLGISLSNGSVVSTVVGSVATINKSARAAGFTVAGNIRYRIPNCWILFCYKPAPSAIVSIKAAAGFGEQPINKTVYTNSSGYYKSGSIMNHGCSGVTVSASYQGKTTTQSMPTPWFCSGTVTMNLDI